MSFRILCLAVFFAAGCQGDPAEPEERSGVPLESCLEGPAQEEAERHAGMTGATSAIVPMGRAVTPAGLVVEVKNRPLAGAFSPDGAEAYIVHNGAYVMEVIDVTDGEVLQTVPGVGGFRGVLAGPDGEWVMTADTLEGSVSKLSRDGEGLWQVEATLSVAGAPTTLSFAPGDGRAIVVSGMSSKVWEVDPETLEVAAEYETHGVYPYAAALNAAETHVFFSHIGDDKVTGIVRATGEVLGHIPVGLNPTGMASDPERGLLYVANTDSDTLSVISMDPFELIETVEIPGPVEGVVGSGPNEVLLSPDGQRLFISFADLNCVRVFSLPDLEVLGAIPTGFYATGLAATTAGERLLTIGTKGFGGADKLHNSLGVVTFVPLDPDADTLAEWTAQVEENLARPVGLFDGSECVSPLPLPLDPDEEPVIEHVMLIVRENKTYDAIFGDMEDTEADPELVVFGEEYTPNLHALARAFVNMDNYYADSEDSYPGHTWTTQADCNDFFEKIWPNGPNQFALIGVDPSLMLAERSIFTHCFEHGVSFRNYGEFESFGKELMGDWEQFANIKYPYFNMSIPDVWKAKEFIREMELGIFPEFIYMALPNDHAAGGREGMPTPASMVADNDEATGMIVDAISHSPYWESTIIFIIEDDPQGYGGDHIHPQRSICVVASPWVRRSYLSSVQYSIPALYRTIEMLLRLPPMNTNTALATPMIDIFLPRDDEDGLDPTPYDGIPMQIPWEENPPGNAFAEVSASIDITHPDGNKGMGEILWRMMNGDREPPPYAKWRDE